MLTLMKKRILTGDFNTNSIYNDMCLLREVLQDEIPI